ncbi:MAG: alpha/beta fold hydrolase, partial [Rhodospirillaceae bacterium]|nr:alpha/beta fold hydrolase [Rhodospirillaceae bacterium]
MNEKPEILPRADGASIAYHRLAGEGPGIVFLGGFASDMTGTKAIALEAHCRRRGQAFLRFDYRGHGQSSGAFEEGSIGLWAGDAIAAIDALTEGPQILVGSSMGGWIMLLAARALPDRAAALVGIAAAPDFTPRMWEELPEEARAAGETADYQYSWKRQNWFEHAAAEHKAVRENVGLFDMSSFAKFRVEGRDAEAVLQRVMAADVAVEPGRLVYGQWLNHRGGVEADLTVTR